MKHNWILLDEHFYPENQAVFPLTDRGFLFGEGIFTTIRVHEGKPEFLSQHLQRLKEHAQILKFSFPLLDLNRIKELIRLNEACTGTWRLKIVITIKRENQHLTNGHVLATLTPYVEKLAPCKLSLFPIPCYRPLAHLKSLSYLDLLYVKDYALAHGYDDAIMQTEKGYLLETSSANFFWIDQEGCWIPDLNLPYLKGILLTNLIEQLSLPLHFVKKTLSQIPETAHLYLCNSLIHIQPVTAVGHFTFKRSFEREHLLNNLLKEALLSSPFLD